MPYNIFFTSLKLFCRLRKWNQTKLISRRVKTSGLKFRCLQLHKAIFFCIHFLYFGTIILLHIYGHWWVLLLESLSAQHFRTTLFLLFSYPKWQLVIFSDEYRIWTFRLLTAFIISSRWQEDLCPLVMEVESLHGYLSAAYVSLLCLPSHYSPKTCVQLCHVVQSNGLHALIASLEKKKEKSVIFHWSYQKDFLQLDDFCVPHFAFSFKFQVQMNPK